MQRSDARVLRDQAADLRQPVHGAVENRNLATHRFEQRQHVVRQQAFLIEHTLIDDDQVLPGVSRSVVLLRAIAIDAVLRPLLEWVVGRRIERDPWQVSGEQDA